MKRILCVLLFAAAALGSSVSARAPELIYFYPGTVTTNQVTVPLPGASEWVLITNDGATRVYLLFGSGTVNTTTGEGGGYLEPTESFRFDTRTTTVNFKCASSSTTVRMWSGYYPFQ